jgi:peptidoglycan/xylan/chitin deacetylase (PgdA/CDA1 family)
MIDDRLPLLPLLLADVPASLCRALEQEGVPTAAFVPGVRDGRFVVFDSARGVPPAIRPQQMLVDVNALRSRGQSDPLAALDDVRPARKLWQVGEQLVSEEVAYVDKRAVCQRLLAGLRSTIEAAGGVWMRLSPYPYPYRSAFCFRLDHDQYVPNDFDAVLTATHGHEDAFSHYVCGSSFEPHPAAMARLAGLDVGSHGFHHHTYRDPIENRRNIERGIDVLRAAGIEPSGFVAPHGRFQPSLPRTLAELSVTHSSEFGWAYDDLPSPVDEWPVLQIPIHPVCLGICLEAVERSGGGERARRSAVDAIIAHFDRVARAKHQAGEPVFLYGHPDGRLGRYPEVIRAALKTISQLGAIWPTNFTHMAAWWRARANVQLSVVGELGQYRVEVSGQPAGYRLGLEYWRGEQVALLPLDGPQVQFATSALNYQRRPAGEALESARRDQSPTLREGLLRYLDWEKVTPVDEIRARTWRGWMKRTLRRMRS